MSILTALIIYTTLKEFSEMACPEAVWTRYLDTTGSVGAMSVAMGEYVVGNPIQVQLFSKELEGVDGPWHNYLCTYENADNIRKYFAYLEGELA